MSCRIPASPKSAIDDSGALPSASTLDEATSRHRERARL